MSEHENVIIQDVALSSSRHTSSRLIGPLILAVSGGLGLFATDNFFDQLKKGPDISNRAEIDAEYSQEKNIAEEKFLHLGIFSIMQISGAAIWFTLSSEVKD